MSERPVPDRKVPDGFELVAVPDPGLKWAVDAGHPCRSGAAPGRKACGRPSVAALNRGRSGHGISVPCWWAYCELHMYGRWVEDGQVMTWILRETEAAGG